nr:MAG TPA_asm: hypothetical protein [Caudoviricetes sp.]
MHGLARPQPKEQVDCIKDNREGEEQRAEKTAAAPRLFDLRTRKKRKI